MVRGTIFLSGAGDAVMVGATAFFLKLRTYASVAGTKASCFGLSTKGVVKGAVLRIGNRRCFLQAIAFPESSRQISYQHPTPSLQ